MFSHIAPYRKFYVLVFTISYLLASCTKDESILKDDDSVQNGPERIAAKKLYEDYYVASMNASTDTPWTGDEPSCSAGAVPQITKDKIFKRLQYFRRAAGLNNDIAENSSKSEKAQQAALMMMANGKLEHFPPESWKCYSAEGKSGAGNSLLAFQNNANAIDAYIRDAGSDNGPVGHRRWLLWPRLQEIGIGNTNGSNAVWVLGNAGLAPTDAPEFIAWPPKGYVPKSLIYSRWSFSVTNADFTAAKVTMKDQDGKDISVQMEELVGIYGDNTIVWLPLGLSTIESFYNTEDVKYTVKIEGVGLDGQNKDYEYEVIQFNPNS